MTETLCSLKVAPLMSPDLQFLATIILLSASMEYDYFKYLLKNGIMQCLSFCDWLTSISVMSLIFIYVVAYDRISSFFETGK